MNLQRKQRGRRRSASGQQEAREFAARAGETPAVPVGETPADGKEVTSARQTNFHSDPNIPLNLSPD
jgi:hypothetical protein